MGSRHWVISPCGTRDLAHGTASAGSWALRMLDMHEPRRLALHSKESGTYGSLYGSGSQRRREACAEHSGSGVAAEKSGIRGLPWSARGRASLDTKQVQRSLEARFELLNSHLGTSWHLMAPHGTSWHLMAPHGTSWHFMAHPRFPVIPDRFL